VTDLGELSQLGSSSVATFERHGPILPIEGCEIPSGSTAPFITVSVLTGTANFLDNHESLLFVADETHREPTGYGTSHRLS
jgi:hypothetical protein